MVINHCWMNNGAVFGIIVKGLKTSVNGCWEDLVGPWGILATQWFKSGLVAVDGKTTCGYSKPPTFVRDNKLRFFRIWNRFGGESEVQMHTLEHDKAVEKFKDTRFSGIYMVEADRWDNVNVVNQLAMQLRSPSVPHEKMEIFLDCNPPRKGKKSWLYKMFFRDENGNYPPAIDNDLMEVQVTLEDNRFLKPAQIEDVRKRNSHDPIELARNFRGEWVSSREGTAFKDQFRDDFHVIGDLAPADPRLRSCLRPPEGCFEFPCGWDPGDVKNHAAVIGAKVPTIDGTIQIYVVDELSKTGVNYSAGQFGRDFLEKVNFWDEHMARKGTPQIRWRHWSDPSIFTYSAAADSSVAKEIRRATDGRIILKGVKKGAHSVRARVQMLKRLLFNNRIFISATCQNVIRMLEEIEADGDDNIDEHDPHKHVFDALTYMLMYELGYFYAPPTPQPSFVTRIA